ncbi:eCIS core domain-containing protein [Azohydromonas caseinilytica]|uniref:DUF4157 domain-containing protein n=1 Tax=Azohydromonas caseinilytica TaxID=2728836 RepID=A0A848FER5_9BURK|nr:DUF4157 domain-containing protein [Azohydromonas caseinilytica]NML16839.1 DUF4157 domain-containing protein [Azohydromonas caseinilytica]
MAVAARTNACACGGGCPRCAGAGTRLPLTRPGDAAERDAEARAGAALRSLPALPPAVVAGDGQGLPGAWRAPLERSFGAGLGHVRLHAGAAAGAEAARLGAAAFSVGPHMAFASGRLAPHTEAGRRLLAHEVAHTLQPGARGRLARQCAEALAAVSVPAGDSRLRASARVDLGQVPIGSQISATLGADLSLLVHVPRALQQALARGAPDWLAGPLGNALVDIDISGRVGTPVAPGSATAGNRLCVAVDFHEEAPGRWTADLRLLRGGRMEVPLVLNMGSAVAAPSSATLFQAGPVGVGMPSGVARLSMNLEEDLTASFGPVAVPAASDPAVLWDSIRVQLRELVALRVQRIGLTELTRLRGALELPLSLGGPGAREGEGEPARLSLSVLGDLRLRSELDQQAGRFTLRLLPSSVSATGLGGILGLELSGHGRLSAPLPSSLRLGELDGPFLRSLVAQGEGEGGLRGRLSLAGLRAGRLEASFRVREGLLSGEGSLLSPVGVGGGRFRYGLDQGFSAEAGMVGLTRLVIAPPDERPEAARWLGPYQELDLGSSVYGLGLTGVALRPGATHMLSAGVGPQFVGEPEGATGSLPGTVRLPVIDSPVGLYGGVSYQVSFDWDQWLAGRR